MTSEIRTELGARGLLAVHANGERRWCKARQTEGKHAGKLVAVVRVDFGFGNRRDFDPATGFAFPEGAEHREWSLVPVGVTPEARVAELRKRLGWGLSVDELRERRDRELAANRKKRRGTSHPARSAEKGGA